MSPDEPKADDDDDEAEQPIDMAFPKGSGWKAIVVYLISLPIMLPLYYTLPDTKNDKSKSSSSSSSPHFCRHLWTLNKSDIAEHITVYDYMYVCSSSTFCKHLSEAFRKTGIEREREPKAPFTVGNH